MNDELKEEFLNVKEEHESDVTLQEAIFKLEKEKIEIQKKEVEKLKNEDVVNNKTIESKKNDLVEKENKIRDLTSKINDINSDLKVLTEHEANESKQTEYEEKETCSEENSTCSSLDSEENSSVNSDQNAAHLFELHVKKIVALMDSKVKHHRFDRQDFRDTMKSVRTLKEIDDYEKEVDDKKALMDAMCIWMNLSAIISKAEEEEIK